MSREPSEELCAQEQLGEQLVACEAELELVRRPLLHFLSQHTYMLVFAEVHAAPASQVQAQVEALLARQQRLQERRDQLRQSISQEARCPRRDWQAEFAWDARALDLLAGLFGLQHFRRVTRPSVSRHG